MCPAGGHKRTVAGCQVSRRKARGLTCGENQVLALSVSRDRRDPHLFQGKAKHRGAVSPGVGAEAGHGSRAPCHAWVFTAPAFISLDTCTCRRSCPQGLKVLGASDFGGIGMLCRKECKLPSIRADMLELSPKSKQAGGCPCAAFGCRQVRRQYRVAPLGGSIVQRGPSSGWDELWLLD